LSQLLSHRSITIRDETRARPAFAVAGSGSSRRARTPAPRGHSQATRAAAHTQTHGLHTITYLTETILVWRQTPSTCDKQSHASQRNTSHIRTLQSMHWHKNNQRCSHVHITAFVPDHRQPRRITEIITHHDHQPHRAAPISAQKEAAPSSAAPWAITIGCSGASPHGPRRARASRPSALSIPGARPSCSESIAPAAEPAAASASVCGRRLTAAS